MEDPTTDKTSFGIVGAAMWLLAIIALIYFYQLGQKPDGLIQEELSPEDTGINLELGNTPVSIEDVEFVLEVEDLGSYLQNSYPWLDQPPFAEQSLKTKGKYIKAMVLVNNLGNEEESFGLYPNGIRDEDGRFFRYIGITSSNCTFANQITYSANSAVITKPGIPCTINYLFEVSKDSSAYQLEATYSSEPVTY